MELPSPNFFALGPGQATVPYFIGLTPFFEVVWGPFRVSVLAVGVE
jgi:hypothetical protein